MPFWLYSPHRLISTHRPPPFARVGQPLAQFVAQSAEKHIEIRLTPISSFRFPTQQILEIPHERAHITLPIRKRLQCPVDTAEHEIHISLTMLLPIEPPRIQYICEMPKRQPLRLPHQFSRTMSDEKPPFLYDRKNHFGLTEQRIDIPECLTRSRRPYPSHVSLLSSPKNKTGHRISRATICQSRLPPDA